MKGLKALALATTALAGTLGMMAAAEAATLQAVTTAQVSANWTSEFEGRWKSLGNTSDSELYLGAPIASNVNDRSLQNVTLQNPATNKTFTLSYTASTKSATMSVVDNGGVTRSVSRTFTTILDEFDDLLIYVKAGHQSASTPLTLTLSGLLLNGGAVSGGPLSVTAVVNSGPPVTASGVEQHWVIKDVVSLNTDFIVSGQYSTNIVLSGSNEGSKFEVRAGNYVPIPAALPLLGTAVAGLGLAAWRKRRAA